jgi:RNA polymerase sigma-70 factor (ECF subfamily)
MEAYGGLVWSLAVRMSPTRQDAEDAVQEIFVSLMSSAGRYDPMQASEATFVAMVARRRLIDRRRAAERRKEELRPMVDLEQAQTIDHDRVVRVLEAQAAAREIDRLPEDRRRVLKMAMLEGLTHAQIARATNLPLGTVKSHVRRGLETVRGALIAEEDSLLGETQT